MWFGGIREFSVVWRNQGIQCSLERSGNSVWFGGIREFGVVWMDQRIQCNL